jgi:hypothetical protein
MHNEASGFVDDKNVIIGMDDIESNLILRQQLHVDIRCSGNHDCSDLQFLSRSQRLPIRLRVARIDDGSGD